MVRPVFFEVVASKRTRIGSPSGTWRSAKAITEMKSQSSRS